MADRGGDGEASLAWNRRVGPKRVRWLSWKATKLGQEDTALHRVAVNETPLWAVVVGQGRPRIANNNRFAPFGGQ